MLTAAIRCAQAHAVSGQAAAPPTSVMNSRRREIVSHSEDRPQNWHVQSGGATQRPPTARRKTGAHPVMLPSVHHDLEEISDVLAGDPFPTTSKPIAREPLRWPLILPGPRLCADLAPCVRAAPALFPPGPAELRGSRGHAQASSSVPPPCRRVHFGDEGCESRGTAPRGPGSPDPLARPRLCASRLRGPPHNGACLQFPNVPRS
jgi:hypothetical protein